MGQRKVTQGLVSRIAIGVFGLLTIAMILLAIFDERGALALNKRRQDLQSLQTDITTATEQNKKYEKEIEELRHDSDAIERRARERLKLVKPDEIVIETPEPATPTPSHQPDDSK
jgi:cell division protein FtsB